MDSNRKKIVFIGLFLILINATIDISPVAADYYTIPNFPYQSATIKSRIIFTGFNHAIMSSILGTPQNPLAESLLEQNVYNYFRQDYTNKLFFVNHSYELAPTSFDTSFYTFLNTSAIPDTINHSDGTSDTGKYIPASDTLEWLTDNYGQLAGEVPIPGYSLIIGNFSNLDDTEFPHHWYNETYFDPDSGVPFGRNYMIGYGNQERLYYLDLSADSYVLRNSGQNSTLQELKVLYNLNTPYGQNRLAEYLAEWIYEIERNLWVQDFVYRPLTPMGDFDTGLHYAFDILVLNNLTGIPTSDLNWTVNTTLIEEVFKDILPWYTVEASVRFVNLSDIPDLFNEVQESTVHWGEFNKNSRWEYSVDLLPMYNKLYTEASRYFEQEYRGFYTSHFQTFAFLFDNATFAIPEKAKMEPGLLGIALRGTNNIPLTIISHDYGLTYGNNRSNPQPLQGLTQTIIHELGHQIALMHPFQFGMVGNFVNDPMTYYTHASKFSIFAKDNIQRGQVDTLLQASLFKIDSAYQRIDSKTYNPDLQAYLLYLNASYNTILNEYNKMNYRDAYSLTKTFYLDLLSFDSSLSRFQRIPEPYDFLPLIFVGMLFFFLTTVYYQGKVHRIQESIPSRALLTQPMVDRLDKVSKDRFIESRRKAAENITQILEKGNSEDEKGS